MARFQVKMISRKLIRSVELTVIIPSTTIPESLGLTGVKATHVITEPYPVLYLLHGMGNSASEWTSYSNVELYAEERKIAVVMPAGENKWYRSEDKGDDFFGFISEELPEFIENMFPVSAKATDRYIAGLSMGGYGALIHGLTFPERFAAIGAFSAAVRTDGEKDPYIGTSYDPYALVDACEEKQVPPIFFACGEKDMLWKNNIAFRDYMNAHHLPVTFVSKPGYAHEWRFWNLMVEEFLDWIPRSDEYQNCKRSV